MVCKYCSNVISGFEQYCPKCGQKIEHTSNIKGVIDYIEKVGNANETDVDNPKEIKPLAIPKYKKRIRWISVGLAVVILISGAAIGWNTSRGKTFAEDTCYYLKNDGIYRASSSLNKREQLLKDEMEGMSHYMNKNGKTTTSDGKWNVYMSGTDMNDDGAAALLCVENQSEAVPIVIANNVSSYMITYDDYVLYLDKDENVIYEYGFENRSPIICDVIDMVTDQKGEGIIYTSLDGNSYLYSLKEKSNEIALGNLDGAIQYSADLHRILCINHSNLSYLRCSGDEVIKKEIASDVIDCMGILDGEELFIYYRQETGEEAVTAYDFVDDPYLDEDNDMDEKVTEITSKDVADSQPITEAQKYLAKSKRDEIRQILRDYQLEQPVTKLYCYTKGESTLLSTSCSSVYGLTNSKNGVIGAVTFSENIGEATELENMYTFDENTDGYELVGTIATDYWEGISERNSQGYLLLGDTPISITNMYDIGLDEENQWVYYIQKSEALKEYTLWRDELGDSSTKTLKRCFSTNREFGVFGCVGDNVLLVYRDQVYGDIVAWSEKLANGSPVMLCNEYVFVTAIMAKDGTLFYESREDGVSQVYRIDDNGGGSVPIIREVSSFYPLSKDVIYAIREPEDLTSGGQLLCYNVSGDMDIIDEGVISIAGNIEDLYLKFKIITTEE